MLKLNGRRNVKIGSKDKEGNYRREKAEWRPVEKIKLRSILGIRGRNCLKRRLITRKKRGII